MARALGSGVATIRLDDWKIYSETSMSATCLGRCMAKSYGASGDSRAQCLGLQALELKPGPRGVDQGSMSSSDLRPFGALPACPGEHCYATPCAGRG